MLRKGLVMYALALVMALSFVTIGQADTTYGRFQFYINGTDQDAQLLKQDGTPIQPSEVESLYGTPDGMTVYDGAVDVCSWQYVALKGLARKKRPVYQDLSDAAGWPGIYVSPDTVAIDPVLGRFKVAEGSTGVTNLSALPGDAEVILVWANPTYADWAGTKIVRKVGSYPVNETDGTVVFDGKAISLTDSGLTNATTYYYAAFAYDGLGNHSTGTAQVSATPQVGLTSPNVVLNPGFEDGDTDGDGVGNNWGWWALSTSDATFSLNSAIKHEGVYSQQIYLGPASAATAFVKQTVSLNDNTTYTFAVWGQTEAANYIKVQAIGAGWLFSTSFTITSPGAFKQGSKVFTTPDNGGVPISTTLKIIHSGPVDPDTSIYIDTVLLVEADASAEPEIEIVGSARTGFGVPGWGTVKVQGNYAYIAAGEGDFQVIDISNTTAPFVAAYFHADFNSHVDVSGNYAYLQGYNGIKTVDISTPTNPQWPNGAEQHPNNNNMPWLPSGGGSSNEVLIRNGYGYVTVGGSTTAFYILDITDPTDLVELGSVTVSDTAGAKELFINAAGDRAYIGLGSGGGAILNISSPTAPTLLGSYTVEPGEDPVYDKPWLIGTSGTTMIMTIRKRWPNYPPSRAAKILLVDASNPASPYRRGVYSFGTDADPGPNWIYFRRADSSGNYIYVTDQNENSFGSLDRLMAKTRLLTFNISDLDNLVLADEYIQTEPSRYQYVSIYGQDLYINDYNYGVRIFDLASPAAPAQIGGTVTAGEGHYTWVNEDASYAYLTQTFGGSIFVVDVTDPGNPVKHGIYWDGDWTERAPFVGRGNYLYVPQRVSIAIVDVSNPDAPVKAGDFPGLAGTYDEEWPRISLFGDYAYVTTVQDDVIYLQFKKVLHIYDISNPANPTLKSSTELVTGSADASSPQVFAQGNYAYVMLGGELTLKVIDVQNPLSPTVVGTLYDPTNFFFYSYLGEAAGRLFVARGYAYIATGLGGANRLMHIVDVSDPANPTFSAGFTNTDQGSARDIRVSGDYLYTGSYGSLFIYDISTPTSPQFVAESNESYVAEWSSGPVLGEYLYSASLWQLSVVAALRDTERMAGTVTVDATIDTQNPTVTITYPSNNDTVSGVITVQGTASDDVALDKVEVSIDGGAYDLATGTSNWTYQLDTTTLSNGNHTITARATDTASKTATDMITVNVNNVAGDTVTITKAEWDEGKERLKVEATSSAGGSVTLTCVGWGTMTYKADKDLHKGKWDATSNPGTVTVESTGGGSDTATVVTK